MSSTPEVCALCGLPLRYGRCVGQHGDRELHFCCQGCRQVYSVLAEAADAGDPADFRHTTLFQRCVAMGIIPSSEEALAAAHAAVRDDARQGAPPSTVEREDFLTLHLAVSGMWCPACAWVIEEALRKQSGIDQAHCNFSTDRLRCTYDPTRTAPDRIQTIVRKLGYHADLPDTMRTDRERRRAFVRFAVSTFLTMNVMMLALALYTGFFTALEKEAVWKISWPMFMMATVVMGYGGLPLFHKGLSGILAGQAGMEALVGIGALSAYGYSVVNLLQGSLHLYFDTACMLIVLVQLGKLLEGWAKNRIQEDLGHYYALMPAKVRFCRDIDDQGRYVAAEMLQSGDLFRVTEGETLPADGLIARGRGLVDASSLTGEARPLPKAAGDRLVSGTRVVAGRFVVRAEEVGREAMLGQMLRIMDGALGRKIAVEGRTDRILRIFVPVMVGLAAGTALVLLMRGAAFETAFVRGLTVLVISCPCALGVAVPLARVAGVTLAARKGILVQEFAAFDLAQRIDTVVFDKTGTLTRGNWQLQTIVSLSALDEKTVLGVTAGLEQQVDHVIAVEIRRAAKARQIAPLVVSTVTAHEQGLSGRWDGRAVRLGSANFVGAGPEESKNRATPAGDDRAVTSWIFLSVDDRIVARLGFGDRLKPSAAAAVRRMRSRGLALRLVSGDSQNAVQQVGGRLAFPDARGDQRPLPKAHFIEALRREGAIVAMVGDGINDAPALAAADLSVAIFAGRQLGREAQAVTLMQGDPLQLETFLAFAERVNRKIQQNLWGSLIYNVISIPIAMTGWLSPLVAVGAMLLSSLSVTGNTLLLVHSERRTIPSASDDPGTLREAQD